MVQNLRKSELNLAQKKRSEQNKFNEEFTFTPQINKRKTNTPNIANRLDEIIEKKKEKLQDLKIRSCLDKEREIKENCSFAPNINRRSIDR